MRQNKTIKVNDITWSIIIKDIANEYNVTEELVEKSIISILNEEKITKLKRSNKYREDIIEIINEPKKRCATLYNTLGFIEEYRIRIKERICKRGLMR
jgi:hypothetical protein